MDQSAAVWLVLLVALIAANAPYFSDRLLLVGPKLKPKVFGWRLLELLLLALLTLGLGFLLEARLGQRQPQGWEFYAAGLCLFITLGFPGFVWCYLKRHRHG
ncbi:DUF2818 family protein [Roseateles sp. DAIF2]|uniref:DUF2818 family protein n=1 Tax=Roseateles sp. DAIF2 TaxID=2714952 RepID=UPI0018A26959|nr:DUF2818 family protein [Roseateles sp. DAIF2]QPF74271.1 DUF2818 family protein [Roseateles sp. DAIF2]